MIIDAHTHIFPPDFVSSRDSLADRDSTFRLLYANSAAKLATAEDLLSSMNAAEIDCSVALGFQWQDPDLCRMQNDYLVEAEAKSGGRIVAFCTLPAEPEALEAEMRRCARRGGKGFGELRPYHVRMDLDGEIGDRLARTAEELDSVLVFHVSEPVGHPYAGKEGFGVDAFWRFVNAHPDVKVVGAHWGGGLPFYASMPEVLHRFEIGLQVDTAATSLLYDDDIYARGADLIGAESILFGSDFPLLGQRRSRLRIEKAGLSARATSHILGDNAAKLLGLDDE